MVRTKLQTELSGICPQISIQTIWTHDPDSHWDDPLNKDWTAGLRRRDWQAWNSEIRVTAISLGELFTASAYLGGTWERRGKSPEKFNPTISGYEPQMTAEALDNLQNLVSEDRTLLREQIRLAKAHLYLVMKTERGEGGAALNSPAPSESALREYVRKELSTEIAREPEFWAEWIENQMSLDSAVEFLDLGNRKDAEQVIADLGFDPRMLIQPTSEK